MPYVTIRQKTEYKTKQVTMDDLLFCMEVQSVYSGQPKFAPPGAYTGTVTRIIKNLGKLADYERIEPLIDRLEKFNADHEALFLENMEPLYYRFKIPKKTGGLRPIAAPNDELKQALNELRSIFENEFGALYHTSAFAYVKGRSTVDSIKKHQQNQSKWFLKLDVHNFFGSITPEWTFNMLRTIYPFSSTFPAQRRSKGRSAFASWTAAFPKARPSAPCSRIFS